jgi:hypothetical protein
MHSRILFLTAASLVPLLAAAQVRQGSPGRLSLVIVQGEGALNNLKQRTSREVIVQVEDENRKPVAGAAVMFLLPNGGPGGSFVGGATTAALVTDSNGQAVMPPLTPNQLQGRFQIRVTASYQGRQASAVVNQSNVSGAGTAAKPVSTHKGISGKAIGIIAGVAAAGAVGAAVALRGGGNSSPATPAVTPSGSVTGPTGATLGPPR